jgi:hypothetical protein
MNVSLADLSQLKQSSLEQRKQFQPDETLRWMNISFVYLGTLGETCQFHYYCTYVPTDMCGLNCVSMPPYTITEANFYTIFTLNTD